MVVVILEPKRGREVQATGATDVVTVGSCLVLVQRGLAVEVEATPNAPLGSKIAGIGGDGCKISQPDFVQTVVFRHASRQLVLRKRWRRI